MKNDGRGVFFSISACFGVVVAAQYNQVSYHVAAYEMTASAAFAYCQSRDSALVLPRNLEEVTRIRSLFNPGDMQVWVGIIFTPGYWIPSMTWTNWKAGEGTLGPLETNAGMVWQTAALMHGWAGEWYDFANDGRLHFAVCGSAGSYTASSNELDFNAASTFCQNLALPMAVPTSIAETNQIKAQLPASAPSGSAFTDLRAWLGIAKIPGEWNPTPTWTNWASGEGVLASEPHAEMVWQAAPSPALVGEWRDVPDDGRVNKVVCQVNSTTTTTTTNTTTTTTTTSATTNTTTMTTTNTTIVGTTTTTNTTTTQTTNTTTVTSSTDAIATTTNTSSTTNTTTTISSATTTNTSSTTNTTTTISSATTNIATTLVSTVNVSINSSTSVIIRSSSTRRQLPATTAITSSSITSTTEAMVDTSATTQTATSASTTAIALVDTSATTQTATSASTTAIALVSTTAATCATCATCDVLPNVVVPASLEPGCAGRLQGERCNILCSSESGDNYTNVGQTYFTCNNGVFERPGADFCEASRCDYSPKTIFGPVHIACKGLSDGESCEMQCSAGYNIPAGHETFRCDAGTWQISSACILEGAEASMVVSTAVALEIVVRSASGSEFTYAWGLSNQETITMAVLSVLKANKSDLLHIEVVPLELAADADNGRRLQSSSNGFGLHLISAVANISSADVAKQVLAKLIGTQDSGGLKWALILELQAKRQPIPDGLLMATVLQGSRPPQVLKNFQFAAVDWYPQAWGACSNSCGDGTQERVIVCSAGASLCSQAKPSSIQSCENHDRCAFDVICPLGRKVSIGCGGQLAMIIGIICGPSICLICVIVRCIRIKLQLDHNGQHLIQQHAGETKKVRFRILQPSDLPTTHRSGVSRAKSGVSRASTKSRMSGVSFWRRSVGDERIDDEQLTVGSAEDGRIHVVWDIDQPAVETWFEKTCSFFKNKSASASSSSLKIADEETGDGNENFILSVIDPVFFIKEGERIEYFSLTLSSWAPAIMRVEVVEATQTTDEQVVMYHAMLGHEQCSFNVPKDRLRLPLDTGDKVEVFSQKDGGNWLAGEIFGQQPPQTTTKGYQVIMEGSNTIGNMIPASRLRLRYPAGQDVFVYKGWQNGWISGVVDCSAPPNGIGAKSFRIEGGLVRGEEIERSISQTTKGSRSPKRSEKSRDELLLPRHRSHSQFSHKTQSAETISSPRGGKAQSPVRDVEPWVLVPVICDGESSPELIPSYLLRHNPRVSSV